MLLWLVTTRLCAHRTNIVQCYYVLNIENTLLSTAKSKMTSFLIHGNYSDIVTFWPPITGKHVETYKSSFTWFRL